MAVSGGAAEQAAPIQPPATEEEAYAYKYIGSEIGTPWDIILLADAIRAEEEGKSSISEYNPLLTSLEFCIVQETEYVWIETERENEEGEIEITGSWEYSGTRYYEAKNKILQYLGYNSDNLTYKDASSLVADINAKASQKSTENRKYEAIITVNTEYEMVLKNYIKLNDENCKKVLDLYESQYLVYLYGYESGIGDINVQLPPVTVGNVTRKELAQVAASLINHPYLFGAKSSQPGPPVGPLDCSGFVDWVYIQCFGKGVSGGNLPAGVSVSGTAMQYYACSAINESELKVGDVGFYYDPATMGSNQVNHVGIYIGKINGKNAFIHCGGRYFGYDDRPKGRVGISINDGATSNFTNNVNGSTFSPEMPATKFRYFRRPNFQFLDDTIEIPEEAEGENN